MIFMNFTIDLMKPLDLKYQGVLVSWLTLYCIMNVMKSAEMYCGLLSENRHSGMPCLSNTDHRCVIFDRDMVVLSLQISGRWE